MEEIKITQTDKGFSVEQGNKQAEMLSWDEMLGTIAALTMPNPVLCLHWMKEKKEPYVPKDGDFVTYVYESGTYVSIYKNSYDCYYASYQTRGCFNAVPHYDLQFQKGYTERRPSTDTEKQHLLDALHKDVKDWDESKKEIVEYRWKPKDGEEFYMVSETGKIIPQTNQESWFINDLIEIGNCFRTKAEAQAMADKIRKVLKNK